MFKSFANQLNRLAAGSPPAEPMPLYLDPETGIHVDPQAVKNNMHLIAAVAIFNEALSDTDPAVRKIKRGLKMIEDALPALHGLIPNVIVIYTLLSDIDALDVDDLPFTLEITLQNYQDILKCSEILEKLIHILNGEVSTNPDNFLGFAVQTALVLKTKKETIQETLAVSIHSLERAKNFLKRRLTLFAAISTLTLDADVESTTDIFGHIVDIEQDIAQMFANKPPMRSDIAINQFYCSTIKTLLLKFDELKASSQSSLAGTIITMTGSVNQKNENLPANENINDKYKQWLLGTGLIFDDNMKLILPPIFDEPGYSSSSKIVSADKEYNEVDKDDFCVLEKKPEAVEHNISEEEKEDDFFDTFNTEQKEDEEKVEEKVEPVIALEPIPVPVLVQPPVNNQIKNEVLRTKRILNRSQNIETTLPALLIILQSELENKAKFLIEGEDLNDKTETQKIALYCLFHLLKHSKNPLDLEDLSTLESDLDVAFYNTENGDKLKTLRQHLIDAWNLNGVTLEESLLTLQSFDKQTSLRKNNQKW